MKASGSSDDDAGVFADIISAEALCLDILEDQSPDTNLSHNPFPDYKSISIPTPGMYVVHVLTVQQNTEEPVLCLHALQRPLDR